MSDQLPDLHRRRRAAAGSAAFMVAGPGVVTGLVPWLLTRWNVHRPVPGGVPARVLGVGMIAAGGAVLAHSFARFVTEGLGTPLPAAPTEHLVVGGSWLMAGGAVALISFIAGVVIDARHGIWQTVGNVLVIGVAALPAGMGVAILRYRLYEIDRIISRTLAYTIVTGLLVGVYAGLVLLATRVLSLASPIAVAASTLSAAALFTPVRRRVQRVVDRRFNRVRYDGDRIVEAFAVRLKDAVDLEAVRADLASVVNQALEPAQVSVWINERR